MKLYFIISAYLLILNPLWANASACYQSYTLKVEKTYNRTEIKKLIKLNQSFQGFFKTESKRKVYFKFESGDPKLPLIISTHGLGDDMQNMAPLNSQIRKLKKFRVLSVDTNLSGKSLEDFLAANNNKIPEAFSHINDVKDITDLVSVTKVKDVILLGHSKGGGLSLEYASILKNLKIKIHLIVGLAPFTQDAFNYNLQGLLNYTTVANSIKTFGDYLDSVPFTVINMGDTLKPYIDLFTSSANQIQTIADFFNQYNQFTKIPTGTDTIRTIANPHLDKFMTESYSEYFIKLHKKKFNKPPNSEELAFIEKKVQACISLTKGISKLNFLESNKVDELPNDIPYLFMTGSKDNLVTTNQVNRLLNLLSDRNIKNHFIEIQNAEHLFPQTHSEEVAKHIVDYFTSLSQ